MYHIVIFEKTNEVEVVPAKWVKGDECMWPPGKVDVVKATKNQEIPGEGWSPYIVRIIYTSCKYYFVCVTSVDILQHFTTFFLCDNLWIFV